jgi:hypothetical protein
LDKTISVEWFRQVANRSGCQGLRARLLIGECGEENKRNGVPLGTQVILQLDTAHAWHLDVRNYTRKVIAAVRLQELLGSCKRMYDISERPHEAVGRGTHGFIIVNDCDKWNVRQIDLSSVRRLEPKLTVAITSDCTTD